MKSIKDPNIEEMREFLRNQYSRLCGKGELESEAEIAIYWFANDNHGGQFTNLYSALSESEFSPGPITTLESEGDGMVKDMYNDLTAEYGDEKENE